MRKRMESKPPKISIITPNFNLGDYLEQTILSILHQNYPNLEYIIIDGGSTDNSLEIIKKYERHLAYWVSEPDDGLYDAIQKGFAKSTGELMGWLNSDDILLPGSLQTVATIFQTFEEVEWLTGHPVSVNAAGGIIEPGELRRWSKYHFYIGQYGWIQQESTFWRRSLWERAGGSLRIDLQLAGDFELWLRFFRYAKLYSTPAFLGGFRFRGAAQLSQQHLQQYLEELNRCLSDEIRQLDPLEKRWIWGCQFAFLVFRIFRFLKINPSLLERIWLAPVFRAPPYIVFDKNKQHFLKSTIYPLRE